MNPREVSQFLRRDPALVFSSAAGFLICGLASGWAARMARRRLAIHFTRVGLSRRAAAYDLASDAPPFLGACFRFAKGWRMFSKRTVS